MNPKNNPCPCGTGRAYAACCGRFLQGEHPDTAEQLMRSRYTAYALGDEKYLLETWHQTTRPQTLNLARQSTIKWIDLKILNHSVDASNPARASVEFVARYKQTGRAGKMQELSDFVNEDGRWFYIDGKQVE